MEKTVGGAASYSVTVLMGKRDEMMMELCARRVLAQMDEEGCEKRLLMSMALKRHAMQDVDAIVRTIVENKVW